VLLADGVDEDEATTGRSADVDLPRRPPDLGECWRVFDEDASGVVDEDVSGVVDEDASGSNELDVVMTGTAGLFGLDCTVFFCADALADGEAEVTGVIVPELGTITGVVGTTSLALLAADCCCRCRCRCVSGGITAPSATSLA
jgi:hypothetical protein